MEGMTCVERTGVVDTAHELDDLLRAVIPQFAIGSDDDVRTALIGDRCLLDVTRRFG